MFIKVILLVTIMLTTPVVAAAQFGDVFVYVAEQPEQCLVSGDSYDGQILTVYVESNEYESVAGVRFRVESLGFGPEHVQSLTTPDGMLIASGDISSGITITFSSRGLHHEPVLYIELAGHYGVPGIWTHDVAVLLAGTWESKPDFYVHGFPIDCFSTATLWYPPDTVEVVVDRDELFSFKALVVQGGYPPNGMVSAVDATGWIPAPVEKWVWAGCGYCPWDFTVVTVPVYVPKGVADGTLNPVTFQMFSFGSVISEKTVVLKARNPDAVEETTWGRVKALYR